MWFYGKTNLYLLNPSPNTTNKTANQKRFYRLIYVVRKKKCFSLRSVQLCLIMWQQLLIMILWWLLNARDKCIFEYLVNFHSVFACPHLVYKTKKNFTLSSFYVLTCAQFFLFFAFFFLSTERSQCTSKFNHSIVNQFNQ